MRKNEKQNTLHSAEKDSRKTYKNEFVEISDFGTYTRKSNRASEKLWGYEDCSSSENEWEKPHTTTIKKGWKRSKTTREDDTANDKDDWSEIAIWGEEVELNTGTKKRGQAQKRHNKPRGKIESEKEDPHEIAASVEKEEVYTATKKKGKGRKYGKNTRENVEYEKEDQEKTVNKSHGRPQEEKQKEKVEESESGNASQPRNRKRKYKNVP